jgi:hypothetical protein
MRKKVNIKQEMLINKYYVLVNKNPMTLKECQNYKGEQVVNYITQFSPEIQEYIKDKPKYISF